MTARSKAENKEKKGRFNMGRSLRGIRGTLEFIPERSRLFEYVFDDLTLQPPSGRVLPRRLFSFRVVEEVNFSQRGAKMKRNFLILVFLFILLILPNLLLADCIPVGQFNNVLVEGKTVTLYLGNVPIVKFDVDCSVSSASKIRLLKDSVCDGDDIEIDGRKCSILIAKLP
jgi:hypothetical protein